MKPLKWLGRLLLVGLLTLVAGLVPRHATAQSAAAALTLAARGQLDSLNADSATTLLVKALDPRTGATATERVRALVLLGVCELIADRSAEARSVFQQALSLDPTIRVDSLAFLHSSFLSIFDAERGSFVRAERPAPVAHLEVRGLPDSAQLRVDGVLWNIRTLGVTPGLHRLQVDAPGFESYRDSVITEAGISVVMTPALTRLPQKPPPTVLVIERLPANAQLKVDGALWTERRQEVTPGLHRIDILAQGYEPFRDSVLVLAGTTLVTSPNQMIGRATQARLGSTQVGEAVHPSQPVQGLPAATVHLANGPRGAQFAATFCLWRLDRQLFLGGGTALGVQLAFAYDASAHLGLWLGAMIGSYSSITVLEPNLSLAYTLAPSRPTSLYVLSGVHILYDSWSGTHIMSQYGVHLGIGFRTFVSDRVALRFDVREEFDRYAALSNAAFNTLFGAGVSVAIGRR